MLFTLNINGLIIIHFFYLIHMLFMLKIDGLIIIHINLNDQINKRVITCRVVLPNY